jgi:predicted metal-binding protein
MPSMEINFDQIVFDPEVQTYCDNPKFKCPHYGHSWCCPPSAPYLEEKISQYKKHLFLIYVKFDLKKHIKEMKVEYPKKKENRIWTSIYRNNFVRDYLEKEILVFLENYNETYNDKLILWDGHCKICEKEGNRCTYDSKEPCRYPKDKRYSMEAVGINVDKTVRKLNIQIEWPPTNFIYRFGLVCFK